MKGHIRKSTAIFSIVIAMLVGALIVSVTGTRHVPVFVDTAHAASVDQGPLTSLGTI